ncbi:MAG: hypothetical protein JRF41_00125 [Deltaproteobacteria bacterium]|nr:hypothetical protein [Deltaproteobacteria bacterium]
MKRQDPYRIKRSWRDEEMREVRNLGNPLNQSPVTALTLCQHPDCARDVAGLKTVFKREITRVGYELPVMDTKTVCSGSCSHGPFVGLMGLDLFYLGVKKSEVSELLFETLFNNKFYFPRIALDPLKATDSRVIYHYKEGILVSLEPETCMVGLAKYLYDFNALESCGKCTPCRAGCFHVTEIMKALVEGSATAEDLAQLEALTWIMDQGAFCQFAPKVASSITLTLREFREEYEAHLDGGSCSIPGCGDWGI